MTKEYIKQLCEMLLKDNLTQNGKRKLVNYIEKLQQQIDKAIATIDEMMAGTYCENSTYYLSDEREFVRLKIIKKILQDEKVK